jgi:hypothetical protein
MSTARRSASTSAVAGVALFVGRGDFCRSSCGSTFSALNGYNASKVSLCLIRTLVVWMSTLLRTFHFSETGVSSVPHSKSEAMYASSSLGGITFCASSRRRCRSRRAAKVSGSRMSLASLCLWTALSAQRETTTRTTSASTVAMAGKSRRSIPKRRPESGSFDGVVADTDIL